MCDKKRKLVGVITDGDIRRYLIKGGNLNNLVKNVMKKLEWTKNAKKKWGSLFMGGVKKISNKDSAILINLLKRNFNY